MLDFKYAEHAIASKQTLYGDSISKSLRVDSIVERGHGVEEGVEITEEDFFHDMHAHGQRIPTCSI